MGTTFTIICRRPRVDMLNDTNPQLKGQLRGATRGGERIYKTLADEEANRNANCNLNHAQAKGKAAVVLLHGAVVVSSETTSLGETRLDQSWVPKLSAPLEPLKR